MPQQNQEQQSTTSQSSPSQFNEDSFKEKLVLAGLPSTVLPEDLIHLYQEALYAKENTDQSYEIANLTTLNKKASDSIQILKKQASDLQSELHVARSAKMNAELETLKQNKTIEQLEHYIVMYGGHTLHCNYVDAVAVGKVGPKTKELDLCDCGFTKIKRAALKITEEKVDEQKAEPIQDDSGDLE